MKKPFNINLNNVEYVEPDGERVIHFTTTSKTLLTRIYHNTEIRNRQLEKICKAMNSNLVCGDV